MFLIRCKCGCLFTVTEKSFLGNYKLVCQNCRSVVPFEKYDSLSEVEEKTSRAGFSVEVVPDNTKFTVSFDA